MRHSPSIVTFCQKEFPSKRGITNHLKTHQTKAIPQKYNRKHGLPVAGDEENLVGGTVGTSDKVEVEINDDDIDKFLQIVTGSGLNKKRSEDDQLEGNVLDENVLTEYVLTNFCEDDVLTKNDVLIGESQVVKEKVTMIERESEDDELNDEERERMEKEVVVDERMVSIGVTSNEIDEQDMNSVGDGDEVPDQSDTGNDQREIGVDVPPLQVSDGNDGFSGFNIHTQDFNHSSFNKIQDFNQENGFNHELLPAVNSGSSRLPQAPLLNNSAISLTRGSPSIISDDLIIVPGSLNDTQDDRSDSSSVSDLKININSISGIEGNNKVLMPSQRSSNVEEVENREETVLTSTNDFTNRNVSVVDVEASPLQT